MAAQRIKFGRLLVLSGVLLPVVDFSAVYFFGSLHSDYDRVRQFMSELGESGRPYAPVVNAWFITNSLILVGFGLGLAVMLPPSRASTAGIALFMTWAGIGVVGGFFPCDPGCTAQTWSGWMHRLLGEISGVCMLPVPLLIWLGVRRDPNWSGFGWLVLPVQVSFVVVSLALGASVYGPHELGATLRNISGLLQWLCWCAYYSWIIVLGLQLLRVDRRGSTGEVLSNS